MNSKSVVEFTVTGMMCAGCERIIEKKLSVSEGVYAVKADYASQRVVVSFNPEKTNPAVLVVSLREAGYTAFAAPSLSVRQSVKKVLAGVLRLGLAVGVITCVSFLLSYFGLLDVFYDFPIADQSVGLTALFMVGLFTSVHCVGMCGGINLSVSLGTGFAGTLLYNAGRIVSYTVTGALAGALGSVVALSGTGRGFIALAGGIFMVIMGLNMLNLFPFLRVFSPRLPRFLTVPFDAVFRAADSKPAVLRSLIVGLLNGLMPCGPLQTMQLYALSSGSPLKGALSMFLFGAGTVPLMLALGFAGSFITRKAVKILMTISGVLVIFLGMELFKTGLSMSGF